jgi:uracil-DNA glycosylase
MLVGEAPSSTDDSTGKPFTGPAGRLLDDLLQEAGIHRRDIWITNLTRCFAGRTRNGRMENRPASAREITACSTWMGVELQFVNPRVILAIGTPAAKALIGGGFRLQAQRGEVVERPDGRLVIATIQPAYVMRLTSIVDRAASAAARADLASDIRLAVQLARNEL